MISVLFLPHYFRGEMFTAYELMRRRFGERVRKLTASIFLVTRALAEGVRVFAISLVISIVLGTGEIASIVLIVLLTLFYTFEGGMTAVIWTDVVQMTLYVAGAIASFVIILGKIPGGWEHVAAVAGAAHKFTIFDFRFAPNMEFFSRTYSFWAGVAGGCFLTTATHGTDQLMVQRLLSARDERQSRTALLASWVVILVQFTLFLLIGVLLYVHYADLHLTAPAQKDRLYPEFVWNNLPPGMAGLIIAAILAAAMANLSAALNSLASTTVVDFIAPQKPLPMPSLETGAPGNGCLEVGAAGDYHCRAPTRNPCWKPPENRLHSHGGAARRLPARRIEHGLRAGRRHGGVAAGPWERAVRTLPDPDRLYLVRAHRNGSYVRDRSACLVFEKPLPPEGCDGPGKPMAGAAASSITPRHTRGIKQRIKERIKEPDEERNKKPPETKKEQMEQPTTRIELKR